MHYLEKHQYLKLTKKKKECYDFLCNTIGPHTNISNFHETLPMIALSLGINGIMI